ncbi:SpoIIE family protein phosphatase [Oscillatoriales cyanobacterium LEGE 11467]|uniref:SpoIIE family protein phosphatase n=1 Tax=Zarconia navalis LEGE 11467 TaxID=1828826 RepID=A0A928ZAA6_9CYAN|nr:GAF domain-containing SpoIIE family protein phosphatase [Zarconia navalis]MBE9042639.1 SpoIIE family protein phosphatase [Zarconia navalis LEGE 11467]
MDESDRATESPLEELKRLRHEVTWLRQEKAAFIAQRDLLEGLVAMARSSTHDGGVLKAALQKTLDLAADLTKSERGSLFLLDGMGRVTDGILDRQRGILSDRDRKTLIGKVLEKGLAGWVSQHRQLGLVKDTKTDDRWLDLPDGPYRARSALTVPILRGGQLLGILTLLHSQPDRFSQEAAILMQATADRIALVLDNADLYNQLDVYSKALDRELEKGRQIQIDFLPGQIPQPPNWEIAACFHPAKQVAGDFYDVFPLDDAIGFAIADICDKGVGAALFMALFRSLIRVFSGQTQLQGLSIESGEEENATRQFQQASELPSKHQCKALQAVKMTNNYIAQNHWQLSMFATLFFGILDPKTGLLCYVNGGHEPLTIVTHTGEKKQLAPTGPAVGVIPDATFESDLVILEPGDLLLGYTDGVTEAKNMEGELFNRQRLLSLLDVPFDSASDLLDRIKAHLFRYIDDAPQFDDITMLSIRRKLDGESLAAGDGKD